MQSTDTLTPKEAAEILKLKPDTVVRMIRAGKIPAIQVGNGKVRHRWVILRSDVASYLLENQYDASRPQIQPEKRPRIQRAGYPMLEKYKARLGI